MGWLIFDGISVLYVLTLCLLMIIIMAIFAQRQILRLRNNSARQRPNVSLKPIAKKSCFGIEQKLSAVETVRKSYLPRLTDCTMIGQHSNAPYVHRMIAVDEISLEIGEKSSVDDNSQLARIDPELARQAGESTLAYLTRVRKKMPSLPVPLSYRIAYMHEAARFRPQRFELKHLMELRSLLNQFVKMHFFFLHSINSVQACTSRIAEAPVVDAATPATPAKGILHHLGQKALPNRKRRPKFGGSDGGRLLAGCINEEQVSLLPAGSYVQQLRRQSDSHRSLVE
ncbi:hypothetical protein NECAME_05202 [Necator americanus]|uniref:Uncharacterized protein n=1 Tax=Necator americanus TaxID=51031 RepID=W2SJ45_NECAM|nr:hypothetical protein NECAME_05202 [Necator americanus]ETN69620.1 hypothetical protein NECAME_05202 [Necator americanus]